MPAKLVERYNPQWPSWFEQIRREVETALGDGCVTIEHVGSTSVPGMTAKPIIDLDVVIFRSRFDEIKDRLGTLGYVHEGDLGIETREAFYLNDEALRSRLPRHHLYVCPENSMELKRHRAFRAFLRAHPEYADRLSRLKWRLAERHRNDKQAYMDGKSALVQYITELAMEHA